MPEITDAADWYAWCFSHGRLHIFHPSSEYPDGAWCAAAWARLNATTKEAALAEKQDRFGDAQFEHHLPLEERMRLIEEKHYRAWPVGEER